MTISEHMSYIENVTSGLQLTGYQKNALVSRSYNTGLSGAVLQVRNNCTFTTAYQKYWNQETDDKFEQKDKNADFGHNLYIQYMQYPVNPGTNVEAGLRNRRKSEWTLFQTGYYDKLDKWHSDVSGFVEVAYEVAEYFLQKEVHYAGASNPDTTSNGREVVQNNIQMSWDKPIENPQQYGIVCATYVAFVLWKSGAVDENIINTYGYNGCTGLQSMFTSNSEKAKWQQITNPNDVQEGDVIFITNYDHVLIYVGDGQCIDQGYCVISSSGSDYRRKLADFPSNFKEAYRYIG